MQYIHAVLRACLEQARREKLVARNVASLVSPPRPQRIETLTLTTMQARQLLQAARDDRLYALFVLAIALGLRRGELLALRWADLDLDSGALRATGTLQRLAGSLVISQPKTRKSLRTLALPEICRVELLKHRERQQAEQAAARSWAEPGLVFVTGLGTRIEPRNLVRLFDRL